MAAVIDQTVTEQWAMYNGDCLAVLPGLPAGSVALTVYSPPFAGLYHYSSDDRDLSNARSYEEFTEHYSYVVEELRRVTMPGRITAVHAADVPNSNTGKNDSLLDFPGDVIRLHEKLGWKYVSRRAIWKEPLAVRNRTMTKGLAHKTIVEDSTQSTAAGCDYLLAFRAPGVNTIPVAHPNGLTEYAGARKPPSDVLRYRGWTGKQTENRFSHWVWRQYASAVWDDIRGNMGDRALDEGAVLPFRDSRDPDDEKHVHPLQLDVITRAVVLWSNPGELVASPFGGVGSEPYAAVRAGRRGLGVELKPSYYQQALANLAAAGRPEVEQGTIDAE
jgi:DNA modification methylase